MTLRHLSTRLWLSACLWLGAAAAAPVAAIAQDSDEDERLVKVAYLYNFAKFTRWPEGAGLDEDAGLTLCVAGTDDLTAAIGQLGGKPIKGGALAIQTFKGSQVPTGCHMLYVAHSEQKRLADLVRSLRGRPVLTVSEIPLFGRNGGMIELYQEGDRLRFLINLKVARGAGLDIHPNLLRLAVVIGQEPAP